MKMMMQAPRDRAVTPEAHEGGAPARPKMRAAVQWAPRSLLGFDSLAMSSPGDASEREADAAARRMMQGLPAQVGALPRVGVQRRCAACASAPATPCATCGTREEEEPPIVQRRATGIRSAFLGIPIVPAGGGAPLPGEVRSTFGRLLGHDLSGVRVHTGAAAARSADGLSAEAYTVGDDMVFAAGRYAPQTPGGRELLAHELAHVAQQRQGALRIQRQVSSSRRPQSSSCEAPSALTSQGGPLSVYRFVRGTTTFVDDLSAAARRYSPTARVIIHGAASEEEWQGVSPAESLRRNQRLACERALVARAVFAFQAPEVRVEHVVNHGQLSGDAEWHRIVAIEALPPRPPPPHPVPPHVDPPPPHADGGVRMDADMDALTVEPPPSTDGGRADSAIDATVMDRSPPMDRSLVDSTVTDRGSDTLPVHRDTPPSAGVPSSEPDAGRTPVAPTPRAPRFNSQPCPRDWRSTVTADRARAFRMTDRALLTLSRYDGNAPADVRRALERNFHTTNRWQGWYISRILRTTRILAPMVAYECASTNRENHWACTDGEYATTLWAVPGVDIRVCAMSYFDLSEEQRAITLVHEWMHKYQGFVNEISPLTDSESGTVSMILNAESYANLVLDLGRGAI